MRRQRRELLRATGAGLDPELLLTAAGSQAGDQRRDSYLPWMPPATTATLLVILLSPTGRLGAQEWQSGHQIDLIRRAVEARSRRDADVGLAGWSASARGMVRFTVEVDHGSGPIERVIRADELRVEVYGEAPNRSKQVIAAWRDTTFQPTGIVYHRDHLGIIANDFGPVIRLGEGEEVRDVPHPLSPAGLESYQFRSGDTLVVASASGTVRVVRMEVRPIDPQRAGIVGALLLDADRAALVQIEFTFTAPAYRDPTVANITVRLENALHESSRWLPWRQSIAIRRATPALVLPLATVIRADWTIDEYELGLQHPADQFSGAAIAGLRQPQSDRRRSVPWPTLPDALPASGQQLDEVTARAAADVRSELLNGLPRLRLLANGGLSRLIHVNRVQGLTLGVGARWKAPRGLTLDLATAVGTGDGRITGSAGLTWSVGGSRILVEGAREIRDVHQLPRRSGLANSMATLIEGNDAGDWYLSQGVMVAATWDLAPGSFTFSLRRDKTTPVSTVFGSVSGTRLDNPALGIGEDAVGRFSFTAIRPDGFGWQLDVERGGLGVVSDWWRGSLQGAFEIAGGFEGRIRAGVGSRHLPNHRGFAAGGAGSLPGTVPAAIGGRRLLLAELARPIPVGLPSPVGRRLAANALVSRLVPFVAAGMAWGGQAGVPWQASGMVVPVVGVRLDLWGPLVRLEAGWAPRTGGFSVFLDAHPDWWPLL